MEVGYFLALRELLQLKTVRVRVRCGPTSSAIDVVETAARLAQEQRQKKRNGTLGMAEPEKFDHVWAVVDADVLCRLGTWDKLIALAKTNAVNVAASMPCIEFWLFLHLRYGTPQWADGRAAKTAFRREFGRDYDTEATAHAAMIILLKNLKDAVARSEQVRAHHLKIGNQSPATPSTDADILACALDDATLEHLRRLRPPCGT